MVVKLASWRHISLYAPLRCSSLDSVGHSNSEIHGVFRSRFVEQRFRRGISGFQLPPRSGSDHPCSRTDGNSIRNVESSFASNSIELPIFVGEQPTIFVDGSPSSVAGDGHQSVAEALIPHDAARSQKTAKSMAGRKEELILC
ncbi:hypothetical protein TIFTF001_053113 [Ficus carica]|uniref:Uncharacterized protein n=1 Tax=Ficus carica TaxID=3494 RepID=A0AA88ENQ1_FICCA|nr:hypothetical protein TIFTF001_053113 [Ficus carica]